MVLLYNSIFGIVEAKKIVEICIHKFTGRYLDVRNCIYQPKDFINLRYQCIGEFFIDAHEGLKKKNLE